MSPFDLRGPQYLAFYVVLTVATILAVRIARRMRESQVEGFHGSPLHDPYAIAFLRGGKNELVRVATVSLVDRGLLTVNHDRLQTTTAGRSASVRKPIERAVLDQCRSERAPHELFAAPYYEGVHPIEEELVKMRLLPDATVKAARRSLFFAGAAVLLFFALVKIGVALSRGRTNVLFLVVLCIVALIALGASAFPRRTARGDTFLREVENLFRSLKLRAPQIQGGGATTELVMLTAVWGVSALPRERFPWARQLFPKADTSSSSSSCSSSCGSSSSCSSSSCGGGCGGGGCGGCGS
jgi:uncharacterized protein (TIGR04222 family)